MKGKILVTPRSLTRSGHPALDAISDAGYEVVTCTPGQTPTEDELVELVPGCAGYLAGVEPVTARVLDAADSLQVIGRNGTGIDNVDLAKAEEKGIKVCRAQGANARGVAELTFAQILSLVRSIPFSDAAMKSGQWERRKGIELAGRTLGLVGCGKIGQITAGFALAFGMKVLAYDPYPKGDFAPGGPFAYASLDHVLTGADIVTLHCPALPDGTPLLDEAAIGTMKQGVYVVNTARGSLIDQHALLAALEEGRVAGVAVDAFDSEPPADWRLVQHPRCIATPHIGGFTSESVSRAASVAVQNILDVLRTAR